MGRLDGKLHSLQRPAPESGGRPPKRLFRKVHASSPQISMLPG